jgi:ribosomal protein L25 (general stress protein Ctc)
METKVRTVFGKGPMRQLRINNITPANLYSGGVEPVSLQFDATKLYRNLLFIQGRNAVVTLEVEGDSKPQQFGSVTRALWWAVVTLTTVGYGDVYPDTILGRIAAALVALAGIGIVAMPTGILACSFA